MSVVPAVAAAAAHCVLVHNHVHVSDIELTDAAMRRVHQLAAVVVVAVVASELLDRAGQLVQRAVKGQCA